MFKFIKKVFTIIKKFVLDIIFPYQCLGCFQETTEDFPVCQKCLNTIPIFNNFLCPVCLKKIPINNFQPHSKCKNKTNLLFLGVITNYKNPLIKKIIHAFKYKNIQSLKKILGNFLFSFWQKNDVLKSEDWIIVPVPLHKKRKTQRGFNQAEILAQELSYFTNYPIYSDILYRKINNPPQTQMIDKKQRKENIKNIFFISTEFSQKKFLKNKNIILIDDVFTTGATIEEAAYVLKKAGAKKIIGLVIAKG